MAALFPHLRCGPRTAPRSYAGASAGTSCSSVPARSVPPIASSTWAPGRGAALERFNATNPIVALDLSPDRARMAPGAERHRQSGATAPGCRSRRASSLSPSRTRSSSTSVAGRDQRRDGVRGRARRDAATSSRPRTGTSRSSRTSCSRGFSSCPERSADWHRISRFTLGLAGEEATGRRSSLLAGARHAASFPGCRDPSRARSRSHQEPHCSAPADAGTTRWQP